MYTDCNGFNANITATEVQSPLKMAKEVHLYNNQKALLQAYCYCIISRLVNF